MNLGWEPLTAPAPVGQQLIQTQLQFRVVMPHASEVVGNAWKPLKERKRLEFRGQRRDPPRRCG